MIKDSLSCLQPSREDEYTRIEAAGGKIIQWDGLRVCGVVAMSRSIGMSVNHDSSPYFMSQMQFYSCLKPQFCPYIIFGLR